MNEPMTLARELFVPRELVFDAWTRADHLGAWYPPEGGRLLAQDVRPGPAQSWQVQWSDDDGRPCVEHGRCVELEPGRLLRWRLETDGGAEAELLVRLAGDDGVCSLELEHRALGPAAVPAGDRKIWAARLDRLEAYFSAI